MCWRYCCESLEWDSRTALPAQPTTAKRSLKLRVYSGINNITNDGHSTELQTHAGHSIVFNMFLHFVTPWLWPLSFWSKSIQGGAKNGTTGHPISTANIPKTPWPNCMETGGLLQYHMLMMDYRCGKFGDCSFSRFGSIVWTERHKDAHTRTQTDRRGWTLYSRDSGRRE